MTPSRRPARAAALLLLRHAVAEKVAKRRVVHEGKLLCARARSVDRMVTTAGETRLTRSAYEC
jgi:hypothetical protein